MQRENIDDKDLLNKVHETISGLDEQRLQELNNLKQLQEIKNTVSELERKRLSAKWGEDHPGVIKTAARLSYNKELINGLNKEIEKANIKKEPLPENAWRVHGKVFDQKNEPVSGVTVFFSDANKTWIRELGNVCTDATGYYSITVDEKLIKVNEKRPLYLSVSDKNHQLLCQHPDPFIPSNGLIENQDVFLDGKGCVPPRADRDKITRSRNTKPK